MTQVGWQKPSYGGGDREHYQKIYVITPSGGRNIGATSGLKINPRWNKTRQPSITIGTSMVQDWVCLQTILARATPRPSHLPAGTINSLFPAMMAIVLNWTGTSLEKSGLTESGGGKHIKLTSQPESMKLFWNTMRRMEPLRFTSSGRM